MRRSVKPGQLGTSTVAFFKGTKDNPDTPSAYINRYDPGRRSHPHYHANDQFQIIIEGSGTFGRHRVEPYCVHFSRAYTPYGPLQSDAKEGWAFLVLRANYDGGAYHVPETNEALRKVPNRRPFQITKKVEFPALKQTVSRQDIAELNDDQGLFAHTLTMPPLTRTLTPDPSIGNSLFVVVVKGSLQRDNQQLKAMTIVHLRPGEPAFEIQSGPEGLQAIVLGLPRVAPRNADAITASSKPQYKKWQCALCAFAYDEALGIPDDGIAPGTRWADVPETWSCPDCSASKADFQMVEV
jgi:rubredoxin